MLAPEPIRPRMAGMGIRALELARALAAEFEVRLLVPNDPVEAREAASGLEIVAAPPGSLAGAAQGLTAAVVSGHAANAWFSEAPEVPVAADLYDPFPIENLHYARTLGAETARHDRDTLTLALERADFFLCASPEQRLFYAGSLYARGRIGAANFPEDPELSGLIAVVPFGAPAGPARGRRAAGRGATGVPESGPLILFGGIYDWYDPELLLSAWPAILAEVPEVRLLFFESPNPQTTPQRVFARVRERARTLDPAGQSIFFSPWMPYAARADLYAAADLAVSIASEGLETELAYRTRLLDAAWGGLPSISVGGGSLARQLTESGAGAQCPRDAPALAREVSAWLGDSVRREKASAAGRHFAQQRTWDLVAAPLLAWCRKPRRDPGRVPRPERAGGRSPISRLFR